MYKRGDTACIIQVSTIVIPLYSVFNTVVIRNMVIEHVEQNVINEATNLKC